MIVTSTRKRKPKRDRYGSEWHLPRPRGAIWCLRRAQEEFVIPRKAKKLTLCVSDTEVRGAVRSTDPYTWVRERLGIPLYDKDGHWSFAKPVWWWVEWE